MSKPVDEVKNRIKEALDFNRMSQQELSDKTGIPKASISQYISGYTNPKADRVYLMAKALHVQEAWLLGYDIPPTSDSYYLDPEAAELADEMHKRPELKVLFDASRNVSKEDLQYVSDLLNRLKKEQFGDDD